MATHSRILSWKVPCTEEPCKKSDRTEDTYNSCFQYWPFQFLRTHSIQNKLVQLVFLHANITLRQTCWVKFFMGPTYTKCACVYKILFIFLKFKCSCALRWLRWQRIHLQYKIPGFSPWVRKIPWRGKWQSSPVFLLGKSRGQRSLAGYSPWGCKESDSTEQLTHMDFIILTGHQNDIKNYNAVYP